MNKQYLSIVTFHDGYIAIGIHSNLFEAQYLKKNVKKTVTIDHILGNLISHVEIVPLNLDAPIQVLSSEFTDQVINLN